MTRNAHRIAFVVFCVLLALLLLAAAGCAAGNESTPVTTPPAPEESAEAPAEPPAGTDAEEPFDFYQEITSSGYREWEPAPGYAELQPAKGPHGDEVQTFLDPSAENALADGAGEWPEGAVLIKDIYRGGQLVQIAAMKKVDGGWYWGEWEADGNAIVEGQAVQPCQGCHEEGTDGTLGVSLSK